MTAAIEIPLRNRAGDLVGVALVDAEDAHLADYRWCLQSAGYAMRDAGVVPRRYVLLHREVLGLTSADRVQADHINGDRLDCRRANLRLATPAQNSQNLRPRHGGTSAYRGVCWVAGRNKWLASVTVLGRFKHCGYFEDEQEAATAASAARDRYFTHHRGQA